VKQHLILILTVYSFFIFGTMGTAWAETKVTKVKSFREWKSLRISEVEGRVQSIKGKLAHYKNDPNLLKIQKIEANEPETIKMQLQLKRELVAVELAKDLTVSDYFAGYLTKLDNKNETFKEIAGRMTPEEVADLMAAYANSVFGTKINQASVPVSGSTQGSAHDQVK
jgi:hypothetical protein